MKKLPFTSLRKPLTASVTAMGLALGLATPLLAQAHTTVQFPAGGDSASVQSSITGSQYHDYVLNARAGQTMSVSLITDDGTTQGEAFFNILPPGSNDVAIYNGSTDADGNASIRLPQNGNYTIRVYLMGDNRDSDRTVPFQLSITIM